MGRSRVSKQDSVSIDAIRQDVLQRAGIGMYRCTEDGVILFMDSACVGLFELDEHPSVVGRNLRDVLRLEANVDLFPARISSHKRLFNVHRKITTPKGSFRELVEDYYVVSEGDRRIVHAVARLLDPRDDYPEGKFGSVLREDEESYRTALNCLADGVYLLDRELRVILANEPLRQWLGERGFEREIIGKPLVEAFPFLDDGTADNCREVFSTAHMLHREFTETIGGRAVTLDMRLIPVSGKGQVTHVLTVVRDISKGKQSLQALRESEEKYRSILENIEEGYYEVDLSGSLTFFNSALCRIFGYSRDELLGMNYREYYAEDDVEKVADVFARVFSTGMPIQLYDWQVIRKDGSRGILELSISLMVGDNGAATGYRGIVRNVTEKKAAEKALREAEQRNRAIINAMPDSMVRLSRDGRILDFKLDTKRENEEWRRDGFLNAPLEDAVGPDFSRESMKYVARALATNMMQVFEFQNQGRYTGITRDYEVRMVVCGEDEVMAITRDITEKKSAEKALRESAEQYRELFENANDTIYTHDLEGRFTSLNRAGERLSGYTREEAVTKNMFGIIAPEYIERARQMIQSKLNSADATQYELVLITKDGQRVSVEVSSRIIYKDGNPGSIQGIARDITERRRIEEEKRQLEAQIQHAQKLEGLGVLAGGIAHDFNNLLVGIMGYAGLALTKMNAESPAHSYVERIEASAQRAAELTNQLLAYSGKGTFAIRPLNLSTLAIEMGRLLSASISKKAVLKYNCSSDVPQINGDASQLHQVIMNLIMNASDAIGEAPGVITIGARTIEADRSYLSKTFLNDDLAEGIYVCLEVSDSGAGMDGETLQRIFDPFFSTKFAGRGLGLAAVLGIVRGHKGAVKVYSELGRGTTFKILFPAIETTGALAAQWGAAARAKHSLAGWKGSGLLLIADDEDVPRQVAMDALGNYGFETIGAANGKEAVELFQKHQDKIVAVLLDLMMPVMSGEEAYEHIHSIRPDVPVVLSSGYTEEDVTERFAGIGPIAFIQKPYVLQDLAKKLREVLEKA